jgi:hypothetical protein
MNLLARIELSLRAACALFLVVAAVAFFWRPALPSVEHAPAGLDTLPGKRSPLVTIDPAIAQRVVAANIFSAARAAPRERYRLYQSETPAPTNPAPAPRATGPRVPQLFGTLAGPGGSAALMRLDPNAPDAQLYREGDRVGTYVVEKINVSSVVLSGPRGRIELRLTQPKGSTP